VSDTYTTSLEFECMTELNKINRFSSGLMLKKNLICAELVLDKIQK